MGNLDTTAFEDIELQCVDSQHPTEDRTFLWEKGEQAFMHQLQEEGKLEGELTAPKRCRDCRMRRKQEREARNN